MTDEWNRPQIDPSQPPMTKGGGARRGKGGGLCHHNFRSSVLDDHCSKKIYTDDCLIRCYYSSLDDLVNHSSQWEYEGECVSDTSTLRYSSSMHPILNSPRLRSWESLECGARLWKWVDGLKFDAVGQLFKVFPVNRAPLCNLTQTTHHFQHHSLHLVFKRSKMVVLQQSAGPSPCSTRWLTCFCQSCQKGRMSSVFRFTINYNILKF